MNIDKVKAHVSELLSDERTRHLQYHNILHTLDVHRYVRVIGFDEGLDNKQLLLVETAALLHDTGYILRYENNEPESIKIAEDILPAMGYTQKSIGLIKGMIEATQLQTKPRTISESVLCDADYAYLGTKDCSKRAELLYKELRDNGYSYGNKQWLGIQIRFLENHRYFTKTAYKLFEQGKLSYLERLKEEWKERNKSEE